MRDLIENVSCFPRSVLRVGVDSIRARHTRTTTQVQSDLFFLKSRWIQILRQSAL